MKKVARAIVIGFFALLSAARLTADPIAPPESPRILRYEHNEVLKELHECTHLKGETGRVAREFQELLRPHLNKEEDFILPQLGLLRDLATDKAVDPSVGAAMMKYSEDLQKDYPFLIAEHQVLREALEKMIQAAEKEQQWDALHFALSLRDHIEDEDDVFYPAAILVGKYLKALQAAPSLR